MKKTNILLCGYGCEVIDWILLVQGGSFLRLLEVSLSYQIICERDLVILHTVFVIGVHTKPSTDPAIGQSLLELMVYIAAKIGVREFIHVAFSSSVSETAVKRYSGRAMRPEHVASKMGHQQLAEYLGQCYERCGVQDIR